MSASGKTTYYNLPIFSPDDVTTWTAFNNSMIMLDSILHQISLNSGGQLPPELIEKIEELEKELGELQVDMENVNDNIDEIVKEVNDIKDNWEISKTIILNEINSLKTNDENLESNISSLQSEIETVTTAIGNIETNITNIQTEIETIKNNNSENNLSLILQTNSTTDWAVYNSTDGINFGGIGGTSLSSILNYIRIGNTNNFFIKGYFRININNKQSNPYIRLIKTIYKDSIGNYKPINQTANLNIYTGSQDNFVLKYSFPVQVRIINSTNIQLALTIIKNVEIEGNLLYEWTF